MNQKVRTFESSGLAQPQPMEKQADTGARDDDATPGKLYTKLVQGQFTILCQPLADPAGMRRKLATAKVSLPARCKPTCLTFEDHQIFHKTRRDPKVPGDLP